MMVTGVSAVLFHESVKSFGAQALVTVLESNLLLFDSNLTLHAPVPEAAGMAAVERIRSWILGNELDPLFWFSLQGRSEMRFASCERVCGEKRNSLAASDKTGLRWS